MFARIRSLFSSKFGAFFALIFIGIIAVAFALGDVTGSGTFGGVSSGNAAKVGDQDISISELRDMTNNRLRTERQRNPNLDISQFVEGGGLDRTLEQIINRYVLAVFGEKHGIGVSQAMVDAEIREIPGAKGIDGKFTTDSFRTLLSRLQISEAAIRKDFTQNLYGQQIFPIANKGVLSPQSLVLPYASLVLERREGQIAVVPSAQFLPEKPPSDDILSTYYKENATQYIIPERRSISYALFNSDIVDGDAKATKEDIQAYYDENKENYAESETRSFEQIIVSTKDAADQIISNAQSGISLQEASKETGLSVTQRDNISAKELSDSASKEVSDAVFAVADGEYAKPAQGPLGWFVVKITNILKKDARTLDQARTEIAEIVLAQKKDELLAELTGEIEDALSDGTTLEDVAKERSLKVQTSPLLVVTGQNPEDSSYQPIPEMAAILPAAFQMDNDGEGQLIEIEQGSKFAIITIAQLSEAAPPSLSKVKELVAQRWAFSQGSAKAKVEADKILKAVESGSTLKKALAESGLKLPPVQDLKASRFELSQQGGEVPEALVLMFAMAAKSIKKLEAPTDQGWILVNLNKITRGDASERKNLLDETQKQFKNTIAQEHFAQFINAARAEIGVEKSEDDIDSLRASLTSITAN